jgi:hypothetical protein
MLIPIKIRSGSHMLRQRQHHMLKNFCSLFLGKVSWIYVRLCNVCSLGELILSAYFFRRNVPFWMLAYDTPSSWQNRSERRHDEV